LISYRVSYPVSRMPDQWMVRVEGREYGPVDTETLREWKAEGRLIRTNELQSVGQERWIPAGEFPEIFADEIPPPIPPSTSTATGRGLGGILTESFRIFRRGFGPFLALSLATALPSICAQLSAPPTDLASATSLDPRAALAVLFSLLMALLSLALWPVFIAGIQIATVEVREGRQLGLFELLRGAFRFWPRVAALCIFVYGSFLLWTVIPVLLILVVMLTVPPELGLFLALALLGFQVWITARLFTNFLFWQQFAVIAGSDINHSLRQSRELARSGHERPWYSRPLWRGAVLASLWCLVVILVNIDPIWQLLRVYFHQLAIQADPQAMAQAFSNAKPQSGGAINYTLGVIQIILRPLLGIAFVVLYFESNGPRVATPPSVN
ncbi:MAG TPA: GYF domain-containing protein, partial [Chthoniobacterales bacterium]